MEVNTTIHVIALPLAVGLLAACSGGGPEISPTEPEIETGKETETETGTETETDAETEHNQPMIQASHVCHSPLPPGCAIRLLPIFPVPAVETEPYPTITRAFLACLPHPSRTWRICRSMRIRIAMTGGCLSASTSEACMWAISVS